MIADLTLLAYAVAFLGGLAFITAYVRTDWWHHPWGRHVMAFTVVLEVIFTLALTRRIFGDYPGRDIAVLVFSWLFAAVIWWRYALIRAGRHRTPTNRADQPEVRS